jgi:outer membrane protein assembly factor BamB
MRLPRRNRGTWIFAGIAVVIAIAVVGIAIHELSKPSSSDNTQVPFVTGTATTALTATTPPAKAKVNNFLLPFYGGPATRTRDFIGDANLNPPFRTAWKFGGNALLEFPATIWGNNLYFLDGGATAKRVNSKTGKQIWLRHVGLRSASSPALDPKDKIMVVTVLSTIGAGISDFDGVVAGLSMTSGKILWKFTLPDGAGSESSPVIVGNSVYFGDSAGTLYSVNVKTGKPNWSTPTSGAIKAGPDYDKGKLFFGTYGGAFYAVTAATGKVAWEKSVGGEFYSTPAVAFGRVYVGNNDGAAYSFAESNGDEAWTRVLGGYVYSGPAVATIKGLGPTVFIGYYVGHSGGLYALNAQTGAVDWSYPAGDAVSGSATVVNNTVYFSTVYKPNVSYGLNARTGKLVFHYEDGAYTTVVADPNALFLMGRYVLYKLVPTK